MSTKICHKSKRDYLCTLHSASSISLCYTVPGGDNMSKTSSVVKDRYNKKTYDQINLRVPKGQKEQIQQIASNANMSVNEFYRNALDKYIDSIGSEKL